MGCTMVVVDANQEYFSRIFCVFEIACSKSVNVHGEDVRRVFEARSREAKCRNQEHEQSIRDFIEARLGGFDRVDRMVLVAVEPYIIVQDAVSMMRAIEEVARPD